MAQANVDSPYSMFGIGQVRDKSMNARLRGMGGVANAMYGGGCINVENPASYAMIDTLAFLFDAGFYAKSSTFSTLDMTEKASNASFDYLAMGFGITSWWKAAVGVQPYGAVGYNMIVKDHDDLIGNYATAFKGSGGLNQVFIGNAFRLNKHFSVGANVNYVFGDTESLTTLYFPDSTNLLNSRRGVDLMVNSFMFDYGILFNTPVGNGMTMSIGMTYDQKVRLKGKQTTFIRTIEGGIGENDVEYVIDTIFYAQNSNARLTMPQGAGFGVALQKDNRWTVGADFNWTQWSRFARQGVNDSLQNSWNVALGCEFMPVSSSVSNYWTHATYRLGGFYQQTFLNLHGNSINKFGITAGMSLPLPKTLSKFNIGLELGQCGTKSDNLIQERYINMTIGISIHERWFMKRKYK